MVSFDFSKKCMVKIWNVCQPEKVYISLTIVKNTYISNSTRQVFTVQFVETVFCGIGGYFSSQITPFCWLWASHCTGPWPGSPRAWLSHGPRLEAPSPLSPSSTSQPSASWSSDRKGPGPKCCNYMCECVTARDGAKTKQTGLCGRELKSWNIEKNTRNKSNFMTSQFRSTSNTRLQCCQIRVFWKKRRGGESGWHPHTQDGGCPGGPRGQTLCFVLFIKKRVFLELMRTKEQKKPKENKYGPLKAKRQFKKIFCVTIQFSSSTFISRWHNTFKTRRKTLKNCIFEFCSRKSPKIQVFDFFRNSQEKLNVKKTGFANKKFVRKNPVWQVKKHGRCLLEGVKWKSQKN